MSAGTVEPSTAVPARLPTTSRNWLVAPWFDVFLIANLAWPLLMLLQWSDGFEGRAGLQFWQVYFVTTPHRWITLAIVFLDRERFQQRRFVFVGWFAAVVVACVAVNWTTGTLTCLLTIDYLWNAWHFAAQHHGVYRIYARLTDSTQGWQLFAERWSLRFFLLYVTARVAVATWSRSEWQPIFEIMDWFVPVIPVLLLVRDCTQYHRIATGRVVYLFSISGLYLSLLWAVHTHQPALMLSLTTASALFHALEYLSIVSWSVRQREASRRASMGWMGIVASQWLLSLGAFLVILGGGAWLIDQQWTKQWLFLNVIAAFLHYAYDGLIWRHRPSPRRTGILASPARA
jgi:hypothetical protein